MRILGGIAAVLLLAGCSSSTTVARTSASPPLTPSQRFVALIETAKYQHAGDMMAHSPSELLAAARRECGEFHLARGSSGRGLAVSDLMRSEWQPVTAAALVDAASKTICP